jgi:hypothetical protein
MQYLILVCNKCRKRWLDATEDTDYNCPHCRTDDDVKVFKASGLADLPDGKW